MLASGLPEIVADDEDLARFLTSSSQFNTQMAKPAAFLPSTSDRETSVFRHGREPRETLWAIGDKHVAALRRGYRESPRCQGRPTSSERRRAAATTRRLKRLALAR